VPPRASCNAVLHECLSAHHIFVLVAWGLAAVQHAGWNSVWWAAPPSQRHTPVVGKAKGQVHHARGGRFILV
jgi:hypothetical protein